MRDAKGNAKKSDERENIERDKLERGKWFEFDERTSRDRLELKIRKV